jgi:hypothetical protein
MEFGDTAGHLDSPVRMVEESVVPAAERHTVSKLAGRDHPVHEMVNVAPVGGY